MRVLVAAGGTGGHVMPALAVSAELRSRGAEVLFVCGTGAAERRLVKEAGLSFETISAGKLRRYVSVRTLLEPFKLIRGYRQARSIIRRFRPDVLFAKGGFVSLPVARAAKRLGVPVVLHESDISPGLANRTAEQWASAVAVSFPEKDMAWKAKPRTVCTGNPIRREMTAGTAARARRHFGLLPRVPVVLVLGGSLGAQAINQRLTKVLSELLVESQVIHQVGQRGVAQAERIRKRLPAKLRERYHPVPFLGPELADAYAAATVIVSRAGGGVAEIVANGKPSILIPLPKISSRGEQIENGQYYANAGAALMLPQEETDGATLSRAILKLLRDSARRARMGRAARKLARPDAAAAVAKLVLDTARDHG